MPADLTPERPIETVHPVTVLADCRVILEPGGYIGYYRDQEEHAAMLARWAKELEEFIRDHRSQDSNVSVFAEKVMRTECSACTQAWEIDTYDGADHCSYCGRVAEGDSHE